MQKLRFFYALMLSICVTTPICAHKHLSVPVSFTATDFQNPPDNNFLAPSPSIAVGPSQVLVAAVNGLYSFKKDGSKDFVIDTSITGFFSAQETNSFTYAAHVRFDRFSQRWFALATRNTPAPTIKAVFYIAISDGPEITACTQWRKYRFEQDVDFNPPGDTNLVVAQNFDFASFGIDQNALYIGLNLYTTDNRNNFSRASVFVISKQSLIFGTPITTAFRNLTNLYAPVAVDNFDKDPEFGYFIGIDRLNPGNLLLYRISNPGTATPTISSAVSIPIAPVSPPTFTFFKNFFGDFVRLLNYDSRLFNAHIRDNTLFTVQHIGVNSQGGSAPADRSVRRNMH